MLFIIAIQGLDSLLSEKLSQGVEGVRSDKAGSHLAHQFYADNMTVDLEGERVNIENCQGFFEVFENASGLDSSWDETTAIQ